MSKVEDSMRFSSIMRMASGGSTIGVLPCPVQSVWHLYVWWCTAWPMPGFVMSAGQQVVHAACCCAVLALSRSELVAHVVRSMLS